MLTKEEIEEFRRIWKEEFGEEITYKEAHDRSVDIATFFEIITEPVPEDRKPPEDKAAL